MSKRKPYISLAGERDVKENQPLYLCPLNQELSRYKCTYIKSNLDCKYKNKSKCNKIYRIKEDK